MYDIDDLKNLVDMAAGGRSPADLLITNAKLVDVLTGEIRETDVSVGGGKILGFSHTEAVKVVDARGAYLLPGLGANGVVGGLQVVEPVLHSNPSFKCQ